MNRRGRSRVKYQNNKLKKETDQNRQKRRKPTNNRWQMALNGERQDIIRRHNSASFNLEKHQISHPINTYQNAPKDVTKLQSTKEIKQAENTVKLKSTGETKATNCKDRYSNSTIKPAGSQQPSNLVSFTPQSQKNLHARYWSYLLDHFHRVFDELYNTCESDECILECQV